MKHLNLFIELTRLKKPTGYMLLYWPCLWGLTLVYDFNNDIYTYTKYLVFFLLGSILMRSAGCIVNDLIDNDLDLNESFNYALELAVINKCEDHDRSVLTGLVQRHFPITKRQNKSK